MMWGLIWLTEHKMCNDILYNRLVAVLKNLLNGNLSCLHVEFLVVLHHTFLVSAVVMIQHYITNKILAVVILTLLRQCLAFSCHNSKILVKQ